MPAPNLKINAKSLVILIAVATALFAANLAVYVISSGSLNQARGQLKAREDQVENSKRVATRLQESEHSYLEVAERLGALERSVSEKAYVPTLLKQLENTGKSVRLDVVGVRPIINPADGAPVPNRSMGQTDPEQESGKPATPAAKKEPPKPYDTLQIDIQVQGTYWNTLRFLDELTRFPKVIAVNSVQITPNGAVMSQPERRSGRNRYAFSPGLNVTLGVSAFVFPAEKSIPNLRIPSLPTVTAEPVAPARSRLPVRVGEKKWRSGHEAG
ncbi:MAG: type 4a pilus biogenesis protein PilO [Armatimonadota bacterium]|nr:type 4a pilus biogenesis protein PilO [Armatimonadota bacterium]